ncbi:unnamed protein product [Owenia fusiformis]|uniref:Uncharacterized protein n=1 Tax=Owenia fusiformis TaxID=6347 RepID=A0A8J1TJE8_OWEFU|nr:unnamed protein product [Owenia fusiformis]
MATTMTSYGLNSTVIEEEDDEGFSDGLKAVMGILLGTMIVVDVCGNLLTIAAFWRDKQLRIVQNYYIFNLAVADCLVGIVSLPFYVHYTIEYYTWTFGRPFCTFWLVVDYTICAESSLMIILISYDRFLLVSQGAQYNVKQTPIKAKVLIGISWFLAFILYTPWLVFYNFGQPSVVEDMDCDTEFVYDSTVTLITAIIEFGVPVILVSFFNIRVYLSIHERTKNMISKQSNLAVISGKVDQSKPDEQIQRKLSRDRKAAKSLAILVVVYFVCWSPYTLMTIIKAICDSCVNEDIYEASNFLLWLNSSLNPFLYALMSSRFRENFRKILCFWKRNKVGDVRRISVQTKMMTEQTRAS